MKLLFLDDFKFRRIEGRHLVEISPAVRDIPHAGPHDLINRLIERFIYCRGALEKQSLPAMAPSSLSTDPAAAAEAGEHRRHGGELYGRRYAQGTSADKRVPQVAQRCHRR